MKKEKDSNAPNVKESNQKYKIGDFIITHNRTSDQVYEILSEEQEVKTAVGDKKPGHLVRDIGIYGTLEFYTTVENIKRRATDQEISQYQQNVEVFNIQKNLKVKIRAGCARCGAGFDQEIEDNLIKNVKNLAIELLEEGWRMQKSKTPGVDQILVCADCIEEDKIESEG
jgi:hypothetical protein